MIDRDNIHFKFGYALSAMKGLIEAMENTDDNAVAAIVKASALSVAKEFVASEEAVTQMIQSE